MSQIETILTIIFTAIVIVSLYAFWVIRPKKSSPRSATYLKFRQGTQITCPECNKLVATANRDIYSGEKMESAAWDWIEKLSRMASPCCGKTYISGDPLGSMSIHTKYGWVDRT